MCNSVMLIVELVAPIAGLRKAVYPSDVLYLIGLVVVAINGAPQ